MDPETDYPLSGTVALNADGTFVMENFTMDAVHVVDDLYGFEGNDNDRDGTDPESTDPAPDILFDLVQIEPESTLRTRVALDLDLLGREPYGDIKFASGYDDPASNKWVYFFNVSSRATDQRGQDPASRPNAEVDDVVCSAQIGKGPSVECFLSKKPCSCTGKNAGLRTGLGP